MMMRSAAIKAAALALSLVVSLTVTSCTAVAEIAAEYTIELPGGVPCTVSIQGDTATVNADLDAVTVSIPQKELPHVYGDAVIRMQDMFYRAYFSGLRFTDSKGREYALTPTPEYEHIHLGQTHEGRTGQAGI